MPYRKIIEEAYNLGVLEEINRLKKVPMGQIEFKLITELIDSFISPGSIVIDIGCGPGVYVEYLLTKNCKVGFSDISAEMVNACINRLKSKGFDDEIIFKEVCCATKMDFVPEKIADAILLMGPLYHLINKEHIEQTLKHCKRILKPGGFLLTVFLSPFAVLIEKFKRDRVLLGFTKNYLDKTFTSSLFTFTEFQNRKVPQYRISPVQAVKLLKSFEFNPIKIRNIEGLVSFVNDEKLSDFFNNKLYEKLLNYIKLTADDLRLLGITNQYIIVSMLE